MGGAGEESGRVENDVSKIPKHEILKKERQAEIWLSGFKSTSCSCRGLGFSSQHYMVAHNYL